MTLKYRISSSFNDDKVDARPYILETEDDLEDLCDAVYDEFVNDYGKHFNVGYSVTIERVK